MANVATTQAAMTDPRSYRLPDIPEKHPDDMTSFKHLAENSNAGRVKIHLDEPETTIVFGEKFICARPGSSRRYPDLGIARNASPLLFHENNGYIVSNQGKPPDFVLEIASKGTAHIDLGIKARFYAELGIPEYWRFDETGDWHKTKLAGDRLVDGIYIPMPLDILSDQEQRGYSAALGLYLCWKDGELDFYDPVAEDYIPSLQSERRRADQADRLRQHERRRADNEARLRHLAEQRVQELERKLDELQH